MKQHKIYQQIKEQYVKLKKFSYNIGFMSKYVSLDLKTVRWLLSPTNKQNKHQFSFLNNKNTTAHRLNSSLVKHTSLKLDWNWIKLIRKVSVCVANEGN